MKVFIVVILFLIALIGVGASVLSQQNTVTRKTTSNNQSTVTITPAQNERYIEYQPRILVEQGDKKIVLFFYANWCPTCKPTDENLLANAARIPEDVVVIRVNYKDSDTNEEETGLAQHYGVTYQHTFIQLDKEGNVVTKWNGGQIEELLENIK